MVGNFKEDKVLIKLGNKLNNPFTTKNMKLAYRNLVGNKAINGISTNTISEDINEPETNAYYVRFLPDNNEEVNYLEEEIEDNLDVFLYDVPFDYEITENGDYYHDPTIPLNLPTWQYTATSSNFDLQQLRIRGIQVEILDELYLPPNYGLEEVNDNKKVENNFIYRDPNFINSLVDEAERLSGNGLSGIASGNISVNSSNSSFNPQGKIQVFDTRLQRLIPLAGVKVRARRWFTIRENKTNENGDYYCATSFNRPVNYAIFYEGDSFDIRSGTYGQA